MDQDSTDILVDNGTHVRVPLNLGKPIFHTKEKIGDQPRTLLEVVPFPSLIPARVFMGTV